MFGILSFVSALQAQQNQGVPWWIWLLVLICVIALLIFWLRRSEARSPASSAGKKPAAVEMKAPEQLPAAKARPLEEAAVAVPPTEGTGLGPPEMAAAGAERAIEVPVSGALGVGELPAAVVTSAAVGGAAAMAPPVRRPYRRRKPVAWRTKMWQPAPPPRYATWKYRRPSAAQAPSPAAPAGPVVQAPGGPAPRSAGIETPVATEVLGTTASQAGAASVGVSTAAAGIAIGAGVVAARSAAGQVDDLTRIEGIGPKIAGLLKANGIGSFQQLAVADVPGLRKMLGDAKLANLADPETWPEQAALAAAGKWDELQSLQEQLIAGRRVQANDLTLIEGIGPKIASLLQQAGIKTFKQLAAADVGRLREILAAANLRNLADPETWPEQAGLAAAGRWGELQALTARLRGGRRV